MTTYLILQAVDAGAQGDWREYAQRDAHSPDHAIRLALVQHPADGVYVAVPARSFKRVTVTTKQTVLVELEAQTADPT